MREIEDEVRAGSIDAKAGSVVLSSMQWRASKRFSKRYGDRSQVAITDAEGNATGFLFGIIGAPTKQIEGN